MVLEYGVVEKKLRPGMVRVAVVYPSIYRVAVASLSFHILYYLLNSYEHVYAERFVLQRLRGEEPPPRSIETGTPLKNFDLILFTVHYEIDYVNIVRILLASRLVPFRDKRKTDDPIIVIGGPPVTANPEPLANIADVLAIGESEKLIPRLIDSLRFEVKERILESLGNPGFYIPSRGREEVHRVYVENLNEAFHPLLQFKSPEIDHAFGYAYMIEVDRGCFWSCAFCMGSHIYRPYRIRSTDLIMKYMEKGVCLNKTNKVLFIATSFFNHPGATKLLEKAIELNVEATAPSIRIETLNKDRLELLVSAGQKTLTIAPEVASPRLGIAIGKPYVEERVLSIARDSAKVGFKRIKMYFMIGFPRETLSEVEAIAKLISKTHSEVGKNIELEVSINPLIPKPQTPLQWTSPEPLDKLRKKIKIIKNSIPYKVRLDYLDPREAFIQAAIGLGDQNIGKLLVHWANYGGRLGSWTKALRESGINLNYIVNGRDLDEELPWNHIKSGPPAEFLRRRWETILSILK